MIGRALLASLLLWAFAARAVNVVEPSPAQKERCAAQPDAQFCTRGYAVKGLQFPAEAQALGTVSSAGSMAVFKPEGSGPFPALILLHTCAPIDSSQTYYWAKHALAHGYVVFALDSWSQRGLPGGMCTTGRINGFFPIPVRVRDAFEALDYLAKLPYVDRSRVGAMGFSHGGRVAYYLARKAPAEVFSADGNRFAAVVSVYGQCYSKMFDVNNIWPDIDVPLLALLGERDEDGDPRECVPRLQAEKDRGAPVDWHVFPGVGHAWDQAFFNPPRYVRQTGSTGNGVLFGYDAAVTEETQRRAFEFLSARLERPH